MISLHNLLAYNTYVRTQAYESREFKLCGLSSTLCIDHVNSFTNSALGDNNVAMNTSLLCRQACFSRCAMRFCIWVIYTLSLEQAGLSLSQITHTRKQCAKTLKLSALRPVCSCTKPCLSTTKMEFLKKILGRLLFLLYVM